MACGMVLIKQAGEGFFFNTIKLILYREHAPRPAAAVLPLTLLSHKLSLPLVAWAGGGPVADLHMCCPCLEQSFLPLQEGGRCSRQPLSPLRRFLLKHELSLL